MVLYQPFDATIIVYRKAKANARARKRRAIGIDDVDLMDGLDFEQYIAELLDDLGFKKVEVTKGSGDQGVDVMATLANTKYGIQCKRSGGAVGNKAVQEVLAGIIYYDDCNRGVVVTNGKFTKSAIELAERTDIILWDREVLIGLLTDRLNGKTYALEKDLNR